MGIYSQWAQKYYDCGYKPAPVHPGKKAIFVDDWPKVFGSLTQEQLDQFAESHGDNAIGLVMGECSGIIGIDWDYDRKYCEAFETLVLEQIDPTPVAKKGNKGWTKFYRYSDEVNSTKHFLRDGKGFLDVLSNGSFTVVPPTLNKTNEPYVWLTPDTLLDFDPKELATITAAQIARIGEIAKYPDDFFHVFSARHESRRDRAIGFVIRNCGKLSLQELYAQTMAHDQKINGRDPKGPYFADENYRKKRTPIEFCQFEINRFLKWRKQKAVKTGEVFEVGQNKEYPSRDSGFFFFEYKINEATGENERVSRRADFYGLAKYLRNEEHLKSNDAFTYVYRDGYYQPLSQWGLKHLIIQHTKEEARPHEVDSFYKIIRGADFVSHDRFKEPEGFLNLSNGILKVETRELLAHTPDMFFRYKLPHNFDSNATCPKWIEFLNFIFEGKSDLINLSSEIFGYAMAGGQPWLHKAFLLYGEGRNGKSTFLDVLKHILGFDNFCSIPIQNLGKPFSAVMADGKLANIIGETTSGELDSEIFKTAVSGEEITAAQKNCPEYQMPFFAKIFFAANKLPYFKDQTAGNYEKLCIIPFERFITIEERDPFIAKKLFTEAPGIINWALHGHSRLLQRGRLPQLAVLNENLEDYRMEIDTVYDWANNAVSFDASLRIPNVYVVADFYNDYVHFCENQRRAPANSKSFGKRLVTELRKKYPGTYTRTSKGTRVEANIEIKKLSKESNTNEHFRPPRWS